MVRCLLQTQSQYMVMNSNMKVHTSVLGVSSIKSKFSTGELKVSLSCSYFLNNANTNLEKSSVSDMHRGVVITV